MATKRTPWRGRAEERLRRNAQAQADALARGFIFGGHALSKRFDRIERDLRAWWTTGRETRARKLPITQAIGHWTAGHLRAGDDGDALRFFQIVEARENAEGDDLSVSVDLAILGKRIFQMSDPRLHATVHVGDRATIKRSIGIEVAWPGTSEQAGKLGYAHESEARIWGASRIECMPPPPECMEAWRWLADAIVDMGEETDGEIAIPRITAPRRRMTRREVDRFAGFGEHGNIPNSTKIDACGYLLDAVEAA